MHVAGYRRQMWFYPFVAMLVALAIIGGTLAGGIYTIALIPIAIIIAASAMGYAMWNRATQGALGANTDAAPSTGRPLPHSYRRDSGHSPTSPETLVDERRRQQ
jgi:hypothetical protein